MFLTIFNNQQRQLLKCECDEGPTGPGADPSCPWDQYGDSSSAASPSASAEDSGKETHNVSEEATELGPWPPPDLGSKRVQPAQPYRPQKANRGEGKWSEWARDVRQSQPESWDYKSPTWRLSAGDDRAWGCKYSRSSEWDESKRPIPTAKYLGGSDCDTEREWHARTMRYGEGLGPRPDLQPAETG